MNISKHFGGKLIDMEPELEPGFDLNYPVPLSKELPGFSGSGLEPGSITSKNCQMFKRMKYLLQLNTKKSCLIQEKVSPAFMMTLKRYSMYCTKSKCFGKVKQMIS